jgi:hypothetical protein
MRIRVERELEAGRAGADRPVGENGDIRAVRREVDRAAAGAPRKLEGVRLRVDDVVRHVRIGDVEVVDARQLRRIDPDRISVCQSMPRRSERVVAAVERHCERRCGVACAGDDERVLADVDGIRERVGSAVMGLLREDHGNRELIRVPRDRQVAVVPRHDVDAANALDRRASEHIDEDIRIEIDVGVCECTSDEGCERLCMCIGIEIGLRGLRDDADGVPGDARARPDRDPSVCGIVRVADAEAADRVLATRVKVRVVGVGAGTGSDGQRFRVGRSRRLRIDADRDGGASGDRDVAADRDVDVVVELGRGVRDLP